MNGNACTSISGSLIGSPKKSAIVAISHPVVTGALIVGNVGLLLFAHASLLSPKNSLVLSNICIHGTKNL